MISIRAFSTFPFSKARFAAYLLGVAAIAGLSFVHFGPRPPEPVVLKQEAGGTDGTVFELVRFGKPSDEVRNSLPAIGIPWFLRRAGVTGNIDARDPTQLVITLTRDGKDIGHYIERVQPIDADRTRLYIAFEPNDMAQVQRLAAPIDTTLDPQSLLRTTLAEHVRCSLDGGGFRLSVLRPGAPRNPLDAIFAKLKTEPRRDTDTFPLDGRDSGEAAIRKAYRDEAERAGAAAPKL